MIKRFLTLAMILIGVSTIAAAGTGKKDKKENAIAVAEMIPMLTEEDLSELAIEIAEYNGTESLDIAPQTYQVFDEGGELIHEETVHFEGDPSQEMKQLMRQSDFLMEKGDLQIYKIF
ncbi:MAG: hypothetical protein AAGC88_00400 [Bacteroidota bacterium]